MVGGPQGWESGEAGTLVRPELGCQLQYKLPGLKSGEDFVPGVKVSMSLLVPQVAPLTPPLPCDFKPCWQKGSGRVWLSETRAGALEKAGPSCKRWAPAIPQGDQGQRSSDEEHLQCLDRGPTQPSARTVLWEDCYSFIHFTCSTFPESQLRPGLLLGAEGPRAQSTQPGPGACI